ncbi:putative protein kinase RLK-Pelle-CrRLK1L-1 family [Helianthus annuus]|uniref:Protein kinase domain-containing protein n=1 Tax=Helianthus annuus TaxID=4232 RepID=A0A9K3EJJ0_HELAN|nr:uncharacterized protein LOC110898700 isoform X4 [Helianthus annuus]KAF5774410.1 putative protein kinase RLK-Pelle-CrRLK1L-1 family [Helianthus annuus]KAJ0850225.1 putative protein kinase RLK-Pelle-CrRLK1L-1 family [Helianthus annuus]KAJ0859289.1 putative protein kinase RLK-Pelle-CrRLK1L-1 family [Helianthus annuus]
MDAFLQQFQHLKIQLEDITSATDNFNDDNCIGRGGFGKVYKGELSHSKGRSTVAIKRLDPRHGQGIPEFLKEITMLSRYSHKNLICLLGFCYHGDEMILVYEHASRGSLDRHLNSPHLTWLQRFKICLYAAEGLSYLHDPRETHQRLIHCDVKSANILLDEQWNSKLSDFGLSIMGPANEQQSVIVTTASGTPGYCDPQYAMTHTLTKESDVYSFGVVLFEVLCGRLCCTYSNGRVEQNLVRTWIECYEEKKLNDITFKDTTIEPLEQSALETFSDIAYRCLKESREDRPRMAEVVTELATALGNQKVFWQQFQDLKIPLEEITLATNHFNVEKSYIGGGAFWKVYKGEVSHSKGRGMTAIKRLDPKHGQGIRKFFKEIRTLSRYEHKNLISLMGFCYQEDEMILVYEYASHGSLDRYLNSPLLTWSQRIKICLDAAEGLRYIHDPRETHERLIHCDVKSANILLDEQWNGKLSDFGLSIMGTANEQNRFIATVTASTHGYCDPQYAMTHTLTKESDVYSFGVVLFEVLCGRLCYTLDSKGHVKEILVPTWIKSYEQNRLNDIIFKSSNNEPMHQSVLKIFSDIAYQCLNESREDRPEIADVTSNLESAFQIISCSKEELLYKGVLVSGGKTWFSLNKKGEHCVMISIAECLGSNVQRFSFSSGYNARFALGSYLYFYADRDVKITHVRTQFLSPGITYTVNLVFKFMYTEDKGRCEPIYLKYKLKGEIESSFSHLACQREDGWWMCELYQFTCYHKIVHLQILFEGFNNFNSIQVEGIEFQSLVNVEHTDEKQPISDSDSDANWEEKLPADYEDIMKWSKNSLQWTTKEEAYAIIRKGFLIRDDNMERGILEHDANLEEKLPTDYKGIMKLSKIRLLWKRMKKAYSSIHREFLITDSQKRDIWFSLDKNGKKCHTISSRKAGIWRSHQDIMSFPESRFGEAVLLDSDYIRIKTEVKSQLVSSETIYACYLVYKLPEDQSGFEAPLVVEDNQCDSGDKIWYIYLTSPQTPVIRPKAGQNTHNPLNWWKIKGLPQQRNDGWIEVQIWELRAAATINMDLKLRSSGWKKFSGLVIEGIEFRPI